MRQQVTKEHSVRNGIAVVIAASLLGLVGLPLVFGSLPSAGPALAWLALAVLECVCLLVPTRPLASALAVQLGGLSGRSGELSASSRQTTLEIARLIVGAVYLVVLQSMLRHPLVAVFGAEADPFLLEAILAILAFMSLLVLLGWIYRTAKPLVENLAWVALDSAFATSSSERAAEADGTLEPVVTPTLAAPRPTIVATRTRAVRESVDGSPDSTRVRR